MQEKKDFCERPQTELEKWEGNLSWGQTTECV